tara:strand:- start:1162 stop:1593 length:432 start_codon:yes stop_codon:yes gene_type:complete
MATSFSTGLNLSPITFNEPSSNAARYGNAVDLGKIWKTNRGQSFSPSDFIANKIAQDSAVETAASNADAYAMGKSLGSIGLVSAAEKQAEELKKQAKGAASKSMWGSALGAVAGIGGTILSGGNPMVGALASKGGQMLGSAIG